MQHPDYIKAKTAAEELLEKFEITGSVIPVAEIAQREGLDIKFFNPDEDETMQKVSGLFDEKSKTIFINSKDPAARQAFTIAHELGHYKLGHKPEEFSVLYRFATPIDKQPVEQEANCFAANLLVPEHTLREIIKKYELTENDTALLAGMFAVSREVIKYRLPWIQK